MSLATLINRPCTLYIASADTTTDAYGNEVDDLEPVTTVCELQQIRRSEPGDEAETSDTQWQAFFLAAEDMGTKPSANKLAVDGDAYEFTGAPWVARNPRTRATSHIEATLRRTASEIVGS